MISNIHPSSFKAFPFLDPVETDRQSCALTGPNGSIGETQGDGQIGPQIFENIPWSRVTLTKIGITKKSEKNICFSRDIFHSHLKMTSCVHKGHMCVDITT